VVGLWKRDRDNNRYEIKKNSNGIWIEYFGKTVAGRYKAYKRDETNNVYLYDPARKIYAKLTETEQTWGKSRDVFDQPGGGSGQWEIGPPTNYRVYEDADADHIANESNYNRFLDLID
jgi:hypothetical protein